MYTPCTAVHFLMTSCKTKCVFFGAFLLDVVLTDSEDYYVLRLCINYTFHHNKQNNNPFIIKYEKSHMTWSNSFFKNTHIWCYDVFDIGFTLTCISLSSFSIFFFIFQLQLGLIIEVKHSKNPQENYTKSVFQLIWKMFTLGFIVEFRFKDLRFFQSFLCLLKTLT